MGLEEFYARLKSVPMEPDCLEQFVDEVCTALPQGVADGDDTHLLMALKDRLFDIRTAPVALIFIRLVLSLGLMMGAEATSFGSLLADAMLKKDCSAA